MGWFGVSQLAKLRCRLLAIKIGHHGGVQCNLVHWVAEWVGCVLVNWPNYGDLGVLHCLEYGVIERSALGGGGAH